MTIEVTAKKVEDAIKQGLEQLGASLDEVQVEILESGGLFRKAKVRLTLEREKQPAPAKEQPAKPEKKFEQKQAEKPVQPEKNTEQKTTEKPAQTEKKPEQGKPDIKRIKQDKPNPKQKQDKPAPSELKKEEPRPAVNIEDQKKAVAKAAEFINELVKKMGFIDASVEAADSGDIAITAPAGDDSLIIGRHGETLSAISFLAETVGRAEKQHVNIVADCNGYRERRAASLTAMAKRRANECVAKRRKIKLEPMERVDRRTVHNALSSDDRVSTLSEGKEPYRYIVIIPKNKSSQKNASAE